MVVHNTKRRYVYAATHIWKGKAEEGGGKYPKVPLQVHLPWQHKKMHKEKNLYLEIRYLLLCFTYQQE